MLSSLFDWVGSRLKAANNQKILTIDGFHRGIQIQCYRFCSLLSLQYISKLGIHVFEIKSLYTFTSTAGGWKSNWVKMFIIIYFAREPNCTNIASYTFDWWQAAKVIMRSSIYMVVCACVFLCILVYSMVWWSKVWCVWLDPGGGAEGCGGDIVRKPSHCLILKSEIYGKKTLIFSEIKTHGCESEVNICLVGKGGHSLIWKHFKASDIFAF